MNEWNIQSRGHGCQICGKHFADKQAYYTLLLEEKQTYARQDVCPHCWETDFREKLDAQAGLLSHWQGVYQSPPPAPVEAIQKDSAESLLRKLIERNDPVYEAASYILAVMLERKRTLKVKEQIRRGSQRIFIYEHPKTGDIFTIPDPNLQLDQLEEVQKQVGDLLEHGLPQEGVPPTEPTPSSTEAVPTPEQSAELAPEESTFPTQPT